MSPLSHNRSPLRHLWLVAALLLVSTRPAQAQCGTGSTRTFTSFTVTPSALTLPLSGVTELDRGWSATSQYTVTVTPTTGNRTRNWYVCLKANTATFPVVSGYAKPVADLQWSLNGTTWSATTVTMQQVTGPQTGTVTFPVYVRLLVSYANDVPGTYGPLPLTFEASH